MSNTNSLSNLQKEDTNGLEKEEYPQAKDILIHFNKNIYPKIEQKYHPTKGITQKNICHKLLQLFTISKKENIEEKQIERSYKELGIQTAQGITDLILGEVPTDPAKIELLLQAMWLDMRNFTYGNISLDYSYAANRYGEKGNEIKKNIIKECLKICNEKFWRNVVTLRITEDSIIYKNIKSGEETIQSKDDFLQNNK